MGLSIHRQLVLKPLIQHAFFHDGLKPTSTFYGPVWETLHHLSSTQNSHDSALNLIEGFKNTSEKTLTKGGATLHWLLKAWRERDPITKFMYLFIPLEAAIQTKSNPTEEFKSIRAIVEASDVENKADLINFLNRVKTKFNPSLNSQFEELAQKHSLPGWEIDVEAFKKFNRMRNLLLHTGNRRLSTHIDFTKHTRTLEDLVERYVSLEIVGNPNVYHSNHRPVR